MDMVSDTVNPTAKGWAIIRPYLLPYLALPPTLAWGCPNCKEVLVESGQLGSRLGMARGFAWSIGLLLVMPALLVAAVTLRVVWAARQHREG